MIDVKKLVTGFLIIAVGAAASGLILGTINFSSPDTSAPPTTQQAVNDQTAPVPQNAFAPQEMAPAAINNYGQTAVAATGSYSNPNNLTGALADAFMNGVVTANPNGATQDSSGNP